MSVKIISLDGKAYKVPAANIVGLETSGNIEQVVQGDKLILVGKDNSQEYSGAGIINVSGNTISANMDSYYTVDEVNDLFDATSSYLDRTKQDTLIFGYNSSDAISSINGNSLVNINEKDWTDEINAASAYAYEEAVAQIPAPFDPTFLSGEIDKKLDKTFSSNFYPMTGNPSNFLTAHQDLSDYATKDYVNEEIGKVGSYVTATLVSGEPDVLNPSNKKIYLTKDDTVTGTDLYKEWIYSESSAWECIGDTSISLDDYIIKTQTAVSIGLNNTAGENCIAQGISAEAESASLAQGTDVIAAAYSLAQGQSNTAYYMTLAQGQGNTAQSGSVAIGERNSAFNEGVAIGAKNYAYHKSFTHGGLNSAVNVSFAQGEVNFAQTRGFTHGTTNSAIMASVAIGQGNSANLQSVSLGEYNTAGSQSIAVGACNSATSKSLAIGAVTYADDNSLAQGGGVSAKLQAFSQGGGNTAYYNALAQGGGNTATRDSMAQGGGNSAYSGSIAQGGGNSASNYSQAFGANNIMSDNGMAIGKYNKSSADVAFVIGNGYVDQTQSPFVTVRSDLFVIDKNGNVSSMSGYFYDKDGKVGGGAVGDYVPLSATACNIGNNNTASAPQSFSQGINNNCLGTESFTQGYGNSAYNGALAQGRNCYASNYSIAQGSDCSALVSPAQAFGQGTIISAVGMAIGQYNKTSANVAFVIGDGNASNRSDLFVIDKYGNVSAKSGFFYDKNGKVGGGATYSNGYLISIDNNHKLNFTNLYCTANSAKYNVAIGDRTYAEGSASVAMGKYTSAFGDYSHSEGNLTRASGLYSHAEGTYTTANGDFAHAEGYYTSAANSGAHAEGYETRAYGGCSHTEGFMTTATESAKYSHAEGYQTTTEGWYSHAEGNSTKAIGDYSLAVGLCTSAKGYYSFAGGGYTIASSTYQVVIGKYNDNKANTLFEVGNGDSYTRANALEVYADGKVSGGDFIAANGNKLSECITSIPALTEYVAGTGIVFTAGSGADEGKTVIEVDSTNYKLLTTAEYNALTAAVDIVATNSAKWVLTN